MAKLNDIAAVTVSAAAVQVVAANPTRMWLVICNVSANPVRVGASNALAAANGIRLAQGEKLVLEGNARGKPCPTDAVFAIREGGTDGTVTALEYA